MKLESFVFGKQKAPFWFDEYCQKGRAKVNYDDEGEMSAKLHTPTGILDVKVGDTIVYTKTGLGMIPQAKAKKYGVQRDEKDNKKVDTERVQQEVDE